MNISEGWVSSCKWFCIWTKDQDELGLKRTLEKIFKTPQKTKNKDKSSRENTFSNQKCHQWSTPSAYFSSFTLAAVFPLFQNMTTTITKTSVGSTNTALETCLFHKCKKTKTEKTSKRKKKTTYGNMSFLYTFESFWRGNLEVFFLNTIKRTVNTYVTNSCSCPFWESFFFFTQTAALSTKTSPHGHSQENTLSTFSFISFHHRGIPLIFWLSQKKSSSCHCEDGHQLASFLSRCTWRHFVSWPSVVNVPII